jgi:predicted 2-oxoglutarate/Fe(II)-dependent dioxygenase YbiX
MILYPVDAVRNVSIASIVALQIFTPEDCRRLIDAANPERWEEGQVGAFDQRQVYGRDAQLRSMRQQPLPAFKDGFPFNVIAKAIGDANSERWRFELTGFVTDDRPWLMRYEGGRKDHFDWHVDLGQSVNASRKLSFSVQLSDENEYEGGDLEFLNVKFEPGSLRKQGYMVLFPSFWTHRVAPTTRGVRHAAVGWVHGPSFR